MRLIDADALMETLGITDIDCEKCDWGDGRRWKRIASIYKRVPMQELDRCIRGSDFEDACVAIENAPTIEERKKGKWLDGPEGDPVAFEKGAEGHWPVGSCWCSECGTWLVGSDEYHVYGDYCPNCGAAMRGEA